MNLKRKGAKRNTGYSVAFMEKGPSISYDKVSGELSLTVSRAQGMGAQGLYEYVVTLSPSDIGEVLKFIAAKGLPFENGPLRHRIVDASHAILQLLIGSSGLQFSIAPEVNSPKPFKINLGIKPRSDG